jgi:hypothetical protein
MREELTEKQIAAFHGAREYWFSYKLNGLRMNRRLIKASSMEEAHQQGKDRAVKEHGDKVSAFLTIRQIYESK